MLVVADASPLILLAKLGLLDLLRGLYDRVAVPRSVLQEVASDDGDRAGSRAVHNAQWLEIVDSGEEVGDALEATLRNELDRGEAAAIALARSLRADLLLIDERQGRRVAQRLGLEVKGTLGVLVAARRQGLLDRLRPILLRLQAEGAWIKKDLLYAALEAVGEESEASGAVDP